MTVLSTSLHVRANGLDHHLLEWTPPAPEATAVLVHGYMDVADTWDLVVPALLDANFRVLAPDMRGFGDAPRATPGNFYYLTDYVADLAGIVEATADAKSLFLIGHSVGGTVAAFFTGSFPGRVAKLALLEGAGRPEDAVEKAPDLLRRWIEEVNSTRRKFPTLEVVGTMQDALRRLVMTHRGIDVEVLRDRLKYLVRINADGSVTWRFDALHRIVVTPVPFFADVFRSFAGRIDCPTMHVDGGPTGFRLPDEDVRLSAIPNVKRVELVEAGHMMHWTRPQELADLLLRFWRGDPLPERDASSLEHGGQEHPLFSVHRSV